MKLGRPPVDQRAKAAWSNIRPAGGNGQLAELARRLNIEQANLNHWEHVPEKHAIAVAKFLNVPLYAVRPDIYPTPDPWSALAGP